MEKRRLMRSTSIQHSDPGEARQLLRELLSSPASQRRRRVQLEPRFADPILGELLLAVCEERIFGNPRGALDLAHLALDLAERLDGTAGERLRVLSLLHVANSLRVTGELAASEQYFREARERFPEALKRPDLRAEQLYLEASLLTDQRRFEEALEKIDRALEHFRKTGNRARRCAALVKKGHTLLTHESRVASALRALGEALPLLDPEEEPRLTVICLHNLILGLNRLGYTIAARSLLAEVRELHLRLGDQVSLLKLLWLQGQLDLELGKLESAETAFARARDGFLELDLPFQSALVSLDLAEVFLQQSRSYKLRRLAVEMFPIFQCRRLPREALAALIVFREAVAIQEADLNLIREVATFLDEVQRNPKLRFRPPA